MARRLRADPSTRGALLIALTGYSSAEDRDLSLSAGFDHHFAKPVDVDRLDEVLGASPRGAAVFS